MLLDILKKSIQEDASDIIITAGSKPVLKIDGEICYLEDMELLSRDSAKEMLFSILTKSQKEKFLNELELDFGINVEKLARFRVNIFSGKSGFGAVFRPIKTELPEFDTLGVPEKLLELCNKKNGLILVTGGVGSGKSTTLASLLSHINKTQKKHIITVEDPIEYLYSNELSLIEQREVGVNTKTFDNGLKYALRQASDVIMIGEMRDLETFRLALRAAETGNLVFATLHTSGAANTVSRVIDMFPSGEKEQIRSQLSDSLLAVLWQDLIKTKSGKGRVLSTELLVNNSGISNMIRKGNVHQINGAMETGGQESMYTMDKCLEKLREKGLID